MNNMKFDKKSALSIICHLKLNLALTLSTTLILSACSAKPKYVEPTRYQNKFMVKYECEQAESIHTLITTSMHKLSKSSVCQAINEGAREYGLDPNKCLVLHIDQFSRDGAIARRSIFNVGKQKSGEKDE